MKVSQLWSQQGVKEEAWAVVFEVGHPALSRGHVPFWVT